ncbi:O-antigen ligase family protein [Vibrio rumoiensis]|uniref:O-antigen ligase family protein n=1 Tax=Vibrio rumoiensis TaxID=76258 RepID=A0ABW7ISN1_9VIBR
MTNTLNLISNKLIILWIFSAFFIIPDSSSKLAFLVIISIITSFLLPKPFYKDKDKFDKFWFITLAGCVYLSLSYFYHEASTRELRGYITALIVISLIKKNTLSNNTLCKLCLIAATASFLYVYYYSVYLNTNRSEWPINAIPYSTLTAMVMSLTLGFFIKSKRISNIGIVTLSLLILSMLLNQSRGIWVSSLLIAVISLYFYYRNNNNLLTSRKKIITFILVLLPIFILSYPKINERIEQTKHEIQLIKKGNFDSSIGLRLQLWNSSIYIIEKSPIIGVGANFKPYFLGLYKEKIINNSLLKFNPSHFHNQYIDTLVKHGLIGLIILLTLILYPIINYINSREKQESSLFLSLLLATTSLTDVPLHHTEVIIFYIVIQYILIKSD